jgi:hypothetical protein
MDLVAESVVLAPDVHRMFGLGRLRIAGEPAVGGDRAATSTCRLDASVPRYAETFVVAPDAVGHPDALESRTGLTEQRDQGTKRRARVRNCPAGLIADEMTACCRIGLPGARLTLADESLEILMFGHDVLLARESSPQLLHPRARTDVITAIRGGSPLCLHQATSLGEIEEGSAVDQRQPGCYIPSSRERFRRPMRLEPSDPLW